MDFPDPAVTTTNSGFHYAYATQGGASAIRNIQVARTTDLVNWEFLGDALPIKPRWASRTQDFWAPHMLQSSGRYFLYFSAKPDAALSDSSKGLCLAVATAVRPEGPFTDSGQPLTCGPTFVDIDPMAFDDPATGKRYLYWGSGFGSIKVQELAPDRISFAPGSKPVELLEPVKSSDAAEYGRLIEGVWVLKRGGWYYLFYSGDNCCGPNAHYAVMVARSRSATGPFRRFTAGKGTRGDVILEQRGQWIAPGHNAVVADARGDHWMVYHAVDAQRPRSKPGDDVNSRRVMLLDRIIWIGGWPRIAGDGPSSAARPKPADLESRHSAK
jgi:arabinan endo-1,5-alpha-L-arabinosidase